MTLLVCPFCGPRDLREFEFRKTVPGPDATSFAAVYERIDRPESSFEHWQHVAGCRAWLTAHRNPSTGEVLDVRALEEPGG